MYRPLYWFGNGVTPALNADLSLALAPQYSPDNKTVTIRIKPGFKWSNGQAVQSNDVVFFLNMLASFPSGWADYVPPLANGTELGIPDLIRSIEVPSTSQLVLHLSRAVNPAWFNANQLSQITPMPQAWDLMPKNVSASDYPAGRPGLTGGNGGDNCTPTQRCSAVAGQGHLQTKTAGCWSSNWVGNNNQGVATSRIVGQTAYSRDLGLRATVVTDPNASQAKACAYVRFTMRSFSNDLGNYVSAGTDTATLFGTTDGPWRLSTFSFASGVMSFVPSPTYAGTKPTARELDYVTCSPILGCYGSLSTGVLDMGVIPWLSATPVTKLSDASKHQPTILKNRGYVLTPTSSWATNFFPMNFASTNGAGGKARFVFAQQYFRVALARLIDQNAIIKNIMHGYGYPTYGPIPSVPANIYSRLTAPVYPYSLSSARALLASHGWSNINGVMLCTKPGTGVSQCGANIPANTPLAFDLIYATGDTALTKMMQFIKTSWAQAGIKVNLTAESFSSVVAATTGARRDWDFASWGGTWSFDPNFYPSGESLYATGAAANVGRWSDPSTDSLIQGTLYGGATLAQYEKYVAQQVPVMWLPSGVSLTESRIRNTPSLGPTSSFTPELWRR